MQVLSFSQPKSGDERAMLVDKEGEKEEG